MRDVIKLKFMKVFSGLSIVAYQTKWTSFDTYVPHYYGFKIEKNEVTFHTATYRAGLFELENEVNINDEHICYNFDIPSTDNKSEEILINKVVEFLENNFKAES